MCVDDAENEENEADEEEEDVTTKMLEVNRVVELSLNSVVGFTSPGTMKVRGQLEGREVVILIVGLHTISYTRG